MLKWEDIRHDCDFYLRRASVIGGWLVHSIFDVREPREDIHWGGTNWETGHQHRGSITFVPDPNHEWKLEP